MWTTAQQDAKDLADMAVLEISAAASELEAEKTAARSKGYIAALRHNSLINDEAFKRADDEIENALAAWHHRHATV